MLQEEETATKSLAFSETPLKTESLLLNKTWYSLVTLFQC